MSAFAFPDEYDYSGKLRKISFHLSVGTDTDLHFVTGVLFSYENRSDLFTDIPFDPGTIQLLPIPLFHSFYFYT